MNSAHMTDTELLASLVVLGVCAIVELESDWVTYSVVDVATREVVAVGPTKSAALKSALDSVLAKAAA